MNIKAIKQFFCWHAVDPRKWSGRVVLPGEAPGEFENVCVKCGKKLRVRILRREIRSTLFDLGADKPMMDVPQSVVGEEYIINMDMFTVNARLA